MFCQKNNLTHGPIIGGQVTFLKISILIRLKLRFQLKPSLTKWGQYTPYIKHAACNFHSLNLIYLYINTKGG